MILLEEKYYDKVKEPLKNVSINHLYARGVIDKQTPGSVYVDDPVNPKIFHVVHTYGMSLLFGDSDNKTFNAKFRNYALNTERTRDKHEWLQVFPDEWNPILKKLFRGHIINSADNSENIRNNIIELNTRVNFKFNLNKYLKFKENLVDKNFKIVRTDEKMFANMKGTVIPSHFWKTAADFTEHGVGFSLIFENNLVTTAYSAFIIDNKLELGMETIPECRGKGFAQYTCSALIDYCIEKGHEPIWACRLENIGSYNLARKLGFVPTEKLPYYRLSN